MGTKKNCPFKAVTFRDGFLQIKRGNQVMTGKKVYGIVWAGMNYASCPGSGWDGVHFFHSSPYGGVIWVCDPNSAQHQCLGYRYTCTGLRPSQ